jgi:vitamin B12 transporter
MKPFKATTKPTFPRLFVLKNEQTRLFLKKKKQKDFYFLACFAFCAIASNDTSAQTAEDITVTATRVPTAVENIPAGVTVIDSKTIRQRGYTTLVDALSAVPGVRVAQSGGPGSQASVFIRGTNSNHVLVLIDGVPVNDPADPGGAFNFGVDTLADVERIEIVRGPMSSLYGSGALGGVINIITRHALGEPHGHVTLAGGVPRQGLAQGDVAGGFGIWDYAASLQGLSQLGFDQTPKRETAVYTGERDGDRSKLAQLEIGVTPVQDTRISLLLRARDAKYGYDELSAVAVDAGNATGYDASLFGKLGISSKLFQGFWETTLFITRLQDDRRYTTTLSPLDPNANIADDRYHGRRTDAQWNNTLHLPDSSWATANSITFGYEHAADQVHTKLNENSVFGPYVSAVRAHADTDSGYVGAQTTILRRLALTGQLREDATTIAGNAFTWRVGGVLDVAELLSHLKASYGTGFRAPALYDRYGIDSFGYIGNPSLRPEFSQGYELGVTTDIPLPGRNNAFSVTTTYFNNRIHNLIEILYAPDFLSSTPRNVNRARTQGVEESVTVQLGAWFKADLAYTYTDARDLTSGAQLPRRPYNQASADLRISPLPGVSIVPEIIYTGAFQDYLTSDAGVPGSVIGTSPNGVIFNLNASWQVTPRVQVFAWGKNLANSRFEPVNGYQTPGASFLAGTRLGF